MKKRITIGIISLMLLIGCTIPTMYYWGKYSETLYGYKKTPNNETMQVHKKSLEDIISKSKAYNLKVPPGVYFEYGYLFAKEGNAAEALKFFDLEKSTYPEACTFVDKMKMQITAKPDTSSAKKEQ